MNILSSRRSFLAGVSAFSLSGCVAGRGGFLSGAPRLKFGVVSDIHITDWNSTEIFRKTLRWYSDQGVDAVMIVGDLADHGLVDEWITVMAPVFIGSRRMAKAIRGTAFYDACFFAYGDAFFDAGLSDYATWNGDGYPNPPIAQHIETP